MTWIAATATFGLVFVLAYWIATKLLERRVSVMERIGGHSVPYEAAKKMRDDLVAVGAEAVYMGQISVNEYPRTVTFPVEADKSYDFAGNVVDES